MYTAQYLISKQAPELTLLRFICSLSVLWRGNYKKHCSASDITNPAFLLDWFWLYPAFNLFSFYGTARELLGQHTSLLATLFIMILSGRSMVLAMARMMSLECFWVGQSNKLYITFCFRVHSRSSCRDKKRTIRLEKGMASYLQYLLMGVWEPALPQISHVILNKLSLVPFLYPSTNRTAFRVLGL